MRKPKNYGADLAASPTSPLATFRCRDEHRKAGTPESCCGSSHPSSPKGAQGSSGAHALSYVAFAGAFLTKIAEFIIAIAIAHWTNIQFGLIFISCVV